jgi:hypothetical protein
MVPPRENWSEVMPSLNADGSLRPDTLWKLFSPALVLVSAVLPDMAEKRGRNAAGTRDLLIGACVTVC